MAIDVQNPEEVSVAAPANGVLADDVLRLPEPSVTSLVSGIIADAQHLIQQQFTMIRQEIGEGIRKTKEAAVYLAAGAIVTLVGSVLLLLMLPLLLQWAVPTLPLWACIGIVGGGLTALGGALLLAGVKKVHSFNPLSDQSLQTMKENLQWTTNPK